MITELNILPIALLEQYTAKMNAGVKAAFEALEDSSLSADTFSFYTSVSAVFSSKIEGEDIDLDSFIKHKRFGASMQPDHTRKIDDLYDAYKFAQHTLLNRDAVNNAHSMLTRHILQESMQGEIRKGNMYVLTDTGRIEYVAAAPDLVAGEMDKLFADITNLLNTELTFEEVLFFASMIHLLFVKIHPFEDGNGRTARLLEKWFLAAKLGGKAWYIQSEKYYYAQHQTYYNNIRALGIEYDLLDYSKALPFLSMLAASMFTNDNSILHK